MKCPFCGELNTQVIDSRLTNGDNCIRRRRRCHNCKQRFTTYEKSQSDVLTVIKKNGSREYFNRKKIKESLLIACNKRPVDKKTLDQLVENIEKTIYKRFKYEIPTNAIGNLVLKELKQIDRIAYVRFASVYREFKDLVDFVHEINLINNK